MHYSTALVGKNTAYGKNSLTPCIARSWLRILATQSSKTEGRQCRSPRHCSLPGNACYVARTAPKQSACSLVQHCSAAMQYQIWGHSKGKVVDPATKYIRLACHLHGNKDHSSRPTLRLHLARHFRSRLCICMALVGRLANLQAPPGKCKAPSAEPDFLFLNCTL